MVPTVEIEKVLEEGWLWRKMSPVVDILNLGYALEHIDLEMTSMHFDVRLEL